jgi:hypothetical protein
MKQFFVGIDADRKIAMDRKSETNLNIARQ